MTSDRDVDRRANELYWSSEIGVNELADELGLSKGALYGAIEPHPTGLACPACGGEMAHPNRTARARGRVTCSDCGREEEESGLPAAGSESPGAPGGEPPRFPTRTVVVAGLLGAAAGLLVGRFFGPRRGGTTTIKRGG